MHVLIGYLRAIITTAALMALATGPTYAADLLLNQPSIQTFSDAKFATPLDVVEFVGEVGPAFGIATSGRIINEDTFYEVSEPFGFGSPSCNLCGRPSNQAVPIRAGDEVWLVSTRHEGCLSGGKVCVQRYECGIGFVPSSVDEYFASADPCVTVTAYVHGNRVDAQTACDRGFALYERLANAAAPQQRLRHVIWSWPSSTVPGFVRDARIKAMKTFTQSYVLADFVARHDSQTNVSLIGFSYGGRIIVGAQHLLGGGDMFGQVLEIGRCQSVPKTRSAIWAPAIPADWIHPAGFNGQALASVDRMLMIYNTRDPMLRFYRKKMGESPADALGYCGISPEVLGGYGDSLEQYNASNSVGSHHSWTRYISAPDVMQLTVRCSLWNDRR